MIDRLDAERDFEEFVVACWPRLCRAAYLLTGDRSDAEDLAQTAHARTYAAWSRPDVAAILRHGRRLRWRRRAGAVTLAAACSLAIAHPAIVACTVGECGGTG